MSNKSDEQAVVLVVGAEGRIGSAQMRHLAATGRVALGTSRRRDGAADRLFLDLSASPASWTLPTRCSVAYLLAAVTSIATCELDPKGSHFVNVEATLELARRLTAIGAHLVVLSTNAVFSGHEPLALASAPLNPQSAYGRQKANLEVALQAEGLPVSILRITKLAESLEPLLRTWARRLANHEPIAPFHDLFCAPIPLVLLLEAMMRLGDGRRAGLYQLSGDRDIGYDEIALTLADRLGVSRELVRPTTALTAGVGANLGRYTTLDSTPTFRDLGLAKIESMTSLADVLDRVIEGGRPTRGRGMPNE